MKKIYLLTLVLVSLFSSCKKDNDSYYIRCTIDGTAKTFNVGTYAHKDVDPANAQNYGIGMGGFATSSDQDDWMGFWIDNIPSGDEIVAGAYDHTSADFDLLATYSNESAAFDYASGSSVDEDAVTYAVTITNHFKLTILSIDNNTIKGTFSGDFYDDGDPRNSKKSVTNGEFYLKFK
jgi:hypothetical protein